MDLKEFVKSAITNISEAIAESQEELKETGTIVNPEYQSSFGDGTKYVASRAEGFRMTQQLEFDITVSIDENHQNSRKGGLKVAVADLSGKKGNSKSHSNQNRLKFALPIAFSTSK